MFSGIGHTIDNSVDSTKKAAEGAKEKTMNTIEADKEEVKRVANVAAEETRKAATDVNEKKDGLLSNISTAAHDVSQGAADLVNKGLNAFKC